MLNFWQLATGAYGSRFVSFSPKEKQVILKPRNGDMKS